MCVMKMMKKMKRQLTEELKSDEMKMKMEMKRPLREEELKSGEMKMNRKRKRKKPLRGATISVRNDTVPTTIDMPSIAIDMPVILPSPSVDLLSFIFGPMAYFLHLWTNYHPPGVAIGEGGSLMPGSGLHFVIGGLFALAIKAQGITGFPFQTNHLTTMVFVSSLIMFSLASTAEHVLSVGCPAPTSISAIVARFGSMISFVTLLGCQGFRNRHHQQPQLLHILVQSPTLMSSLSHWKDGFQKHRVLNIHSYRFLCLSDPTSGYWPIGKDDFQSLEQNHQQRHE